MKKNKKLKLGKVSGGSAGAGAGLGAGAGSSSGISEKSGLGAGLGSEASSGFDWKSMAKEGAKALPGILGGLLPSKGGNEGSSSFSSTSEIIKAQQLPDSFWN